MKQIVFRFPLHMHKFVFYCFRWRTSLFASASATKCITICFKLHQSFIYCQINNVLPCLQNMLQVWWKIFYTLRAVTNAKRGYVDNGSRMFWINSFLYWKKLRAMGFFQGPFINQVIRSIRSPLGLKLIFLLLRFFSLRKPWKATLPLFLNKKALAVMNVSQHW